MSIAEAEVFAEYSVLWYDSNKSGFAEVNNLKISVNGIEMYYEKTGEGRPLVTG